MQNISGAINQVRIISYNYDTCQLRHQAEYRSHIRVAGRSKDVAS